MPIELLVRFCVTDDAMKADLESIEYKGDFLEAPKDRMAVAFAQSLQAASDNGDLPDCMFHVHADSVTFCDPVEFARLYLDNDPQKLVADVLAMLAAGSYHSSYESTMIDKLEEAVALMKRHSK